MKVGLISDTHGLIRDEALDALAGSGHIIHAGDIVKPDILDELRRIAPVTAVRGNNDRGAWAKSLPEYEVVERHHVRVVAPLDVTFRAACEVDLQRSPLINAIFRGRELMMAAIRDATVRPRGILAFTNSMGWGVLAEVPGREVVVGAVTQPWQPNVVFSALEPDRFADFNEPGYVKIAWTIRVDSTGPGESLLRSETRVVATDSVARRRFRRYWSVYSPGILVIRYLALRLAKASAERLASEPLLEH